MHIKHTGAGIVSKAKRSLVKSSEAEWACATRCSAGWATGVHEWHVRVNDVARGVSIGISRKNINKMDAHANIALRYDLYWPRTRGQAGQQRLRAHEAR